jgi:hypothetical protein
VVVHRPPGKRGHNPAGIAGVCAPLPLHGVRGHPCGAGRVPPRALAGHPEAALLKVDHRLRCAPLRRPLRRRRPARLGPLLRGPHPGALAPRRPREVGAPRARPCQGDALIRGAIPRLGLQGRPVVPRRGPRGRAGARGGRPPGRTGLARGTRRRDLPPPRRHLNHLSSLVIAGRHRLHPGPTGPATLDGVAVAGVRLGHGWQRMARVAWVSAALFAAPGAPTARAGLLPAGAARGRAAGATVVAQLGLQGLNPCLAVAEEGSQLPPQGQQGFCALHVGGMDLVWGRQGSGYPVIYWARLLSVLHEARLSPWCA